MYESGKKEFNKKLLSLVLPIAFQQFMLNLISASDTLMLIAAFVLNLPVIAVYCIVNADEMLKLPAVYQHYKKYMWVKDLTVTENEV